MKSFAALVLCSCLFVDSCLDMLLAAAARKNVKVKALDLEAGSWKLEAELLKLEAAGGWWLVWVWGWGRD